MPLPVTVNLTMFAGWFVLEWAIQTPLNGINKKFPTGRTAVITLKGAKLFGQTSQRAPLRRVVITAIDRSKKSQNFQIFFIFPG